MFDFPVTRARGWRDENCEKTLLQTLVPDPKEERVVIKSVAFRKVYPVVPPPLSSHPPRLPPSQQKLHFPVITAQSLELKAA